MHDQSRTARRRQFIDHREAVTMGTRCLVRHQHIEPLTLKMLEILGENGVAVPQWKTAAPMIPRRE